MALLFNYPFGQPRVMGGIPQNWWQIDGQVPRAGLLGGRTTFNIPRVPQAPVPPPFLPKVEDLTTNPATQSLLNMRDDRERNSGDNVGDAAVEAGIGPVGTQNELADDPNRSPLDVFTHNSITGLPSMPNPLDGIIGLVREFINNPIEEVSVDVTGFDDPSLDDELDDPEAESPGFGWDDDTAGDGGTGGLGDPDDAQDFGEADVDDGTDASYARGGLVTKKGLRGPDPVGPDDGSGNLDIGEYVVNKRVVGLLGVDFFNRLNRLGQARSRGGLLRKI